MTLGTVSRRRTMLLAGAGTVAVAGGAALLWRASGEFTSYPRGSPLAVELGALPQGKLLTCIFHATATVWPD